MKRLLTLSPGSPAWLPVSPPPAGAAEERGDLAANPVLYLYPEEETEVTVTLDFDGTLTSTYPDYGDGWTVTARPGGTLTDPATGREYYCLFWEGITDASTTSPPASAWRGGTPRPSWRTPLDRLGLTEREADEFIIYWLPKLEGNPTICSPFKRRRTQAPPFDHRPGPRHPDPGVPGVEGPGRASGGGAPEADRAGAAGFTAVGGAARR